MKKILGSLVLCISLITNLLAGDADRIFAEGNKAYQAKDYGKAVEVYEQLLAAGYRSADLEYNLGNAWQRQGSIGRAILHYERALLLEAGHSEAAKNIEFLRSKNKGEMEALPPFFLATWWKSARMALGATSMGLLAIVLWWAGFGSLAFWRLRKKSWGFWTGLGLLVVSLLPISLALSRTAFEKNSGQAILIQKTAILRSAPNDGSQEVQTIPEGIKLVQLTQVEGWWQVRLQNGEVGWLPEQALDRI